MTPEAMLSAAFWAQELGSYQAAEEALLRSGGLEVGDDTVRQVANHVGRIVFQNDCRRAEQARALLGAGGLSFPRRKKKGVLYIEADGAMFNTRSKGADGSSWRENKLGVVFSSDDVRTWKDRRGETQRKILKREYVAFAGGASGFRDHLFACALRNGYGTYEATVIVGDGAAWIRNMKEDLFPDAVQILDFYHLCENVHTFAKHCFGAEPSRHAPWAEKTCALLKESRWGEVLGDLEGRKRPPDCPVDLHGYIRNNIHSIDYARFLREGRFIGSGAVESGNKSVLQQRLKQAGMRWNAQSAQHLLTLRAKHKSGLWQQDVVSPVLNALGAG